ncbi:probable aquaporin pip2-5-like [Stylonychia lemnae]|uniref:Probable aquaporin pip2-5-like n=1 Tax=Stylonychia lemnae TaxID=5949 RepID=A0A078ADW6_STYLE|nr:probable aquaporin pip2-5-like [Stylonychia lemnae]|eukprot:CDW80400.1 probable aquaporin pip2-5-like [Stylonychia lemnae]
MEHQYASHENEGGLKNTIRNSILILVFEMIGTLFLTLLYDCHSKVSGSHYNPCVTFAFMFRKDTGKFSRTLGIAYILFQLLGAFLGGLLAFFFNEYKQITFGIATEYVGYAIAAEILGSFFLAFLYLTQTEEKTKLSKDPAITTLIIAAAYLGALLMASGPQDYLACLNPAVAFGTSFQQLYTGSADGWSVSYVYLPSPFIGGLIAVIFFEFVYKKVFETIQSTEEDDALLDKNDDE